ncbi:hypothetical protein ASPWEDRAFT_46710 [Aspergillus wentii DTO 134E9]|uniref:DUF4267 domain-containing protein n=1 Tax=Aspergillus wentii DTO 134E9 TaxID=1073089 RepID=A0A1L9R4Z2_ASPWE|nr:uncharacterized protein ASPWEDRAFT_46710 [Aspergillus wentii DTO 134E9]KAI9927252.1 hypothetical protein MW887_003639 [Aspergillus wentii]OJJ29980.1 hypothetical protein ASPWEDRAFT_46710 [Aspergillus wentii DTO 134E9]
MASSTPFALLATALTALPIALGANAFLRPHHALTLFGLDQPTTPWEEKFATTMMGVYGVRDIFMGLALGAAAYFGNRRTFSWILIASSVVSVGDGVLCLNLKGEGEGSHFAATVLMLFLGVIVNYL